MKERTSPRRSRALPPLRSERLLDQVRERVRYLHYGIRMEQAYVQGIRAFLRFHGVRPPAEMAAEVEAFLTWLAAERRVAAATHRQAIVFLYEKVLGLDLPWLAGIGRSQAPRRLPVVLSHGEVAAVLSSFAAPVHRLFAELLYGTGMRLMKACASVLRLGLATVAALALRLPCVREPRSLYLAFPCYRATPSSTARATSAS